MANFSALKTAIQNAIKQNGNEEITGDVLQQILLSIVSTMGDGSINTIEQNLSQETLARQNGDNTLQSNINAEALARGNADTQLQNAVNAIKANIDNGYVYAGIATPSSTPVSGKVFYIATAAGTYTNFGGQVLTQGINILRYNGSAWSNQQLIGIDDVPTAGSNKLVKSGGVQNEFALGAVYDVSAKNPTAGPNNDGKWESLAALLSDANLNTLIPTVYRKGGMSIKFVHTNDNKYVQYILTKQTFSTVISDWEKVNLERDVKNKLNDLTFLSSSPYIDKAYLNLSGERVASSINWISTRHIPTANIESIFVTLKGSRDVTTIAFYDSSKTFLPNLSITGVDIDLTEQEIKIPSGASYVAFCGKDSSFGSYTPSIKIGLLNKYDEIISSLKGTRIKEEIPWNTSNGYIDKNGIYHSGGSTQQNTDFIPINGTEIFEVDLNGMVDDIINPVSFYDLNKNYMGNIGQSLVIGCINYHTLFSTQDAYENGARFIRICSIPGNVLPVVWKDNTKESIEKIENDVENLSEAVKGESRIKRIFPYPYVYNGKEVNGYWESGGVFHPQSAYLAFQLPLTNVSLEELVTIKISSNFGNGYYSFILLSDDTYVPLTDYYVETIDSGRESSNSYNLNTYRLPSNAIRLDISIMTSFLSYLNFYIEFYYKGINNCKIEEPLITPTAIYTVCNDLNGGRSRNNMQEIVLDHCVPPVVYEPQNIHFDETQTDKLQISSPVVVTNSNEETPTISYNGGVNLLDKEVSFIISGQNIDYQKHTLMHRSVLNSATASIYPKVLCIGDSITYGELALWDKDNYTNNHSYPLACKEFFMKDVIDNNGGYDCLLLGTQQKTSSFEYGGQTHSVKIHHEGYRGYDMQMLLTGHGYFDKFWDSENSRFSINAYLSKYRTMDDNGNRLSINDPSIGSLITSDNINNIDVCTPTHIIIALGMNGGATLSDFTTVFDRIKAEFPNIIIGIAIPDSTGTILPQFHNGYGEEFNVWNLIHSNQRTRHNLNFAVQKIVQENFANSTYENNKVFVLPFYYVSPSAESVPNRVVETTDGTVLYKPLGWVYSVHSNACGHYAWGYSLYSWLKYTSLLT